MTELSLPEAEGDYATTWRSAVLGPKGIVGKARALVRGGALSVAAALNRRLADRFVRCLYCHYVFDDQVAEFESLLVRLRSIGEFVGTGTLMEMLQGDRPVDRRYFHLSFDDGFRNNFTNALPVLRRLGVPAIFFVPSRVIGATWRESRAYSVGVTNHRRAIETLRPDDLRAMLDAGYEIGSHTRTHARFADISGDRDRLVDEIAGSKDDLEKMLGRRCRYISWPYGRTFDADASSVDFTRIAGYDACFGAFRGTVVPGVTDRYRIPRHHFEPQWSRAQVEFFARGNMERSA